MKNLKIAIQKSGRLNEKSVQLLKNCGLDFENYKSSLITTVGNFPLEILFLRDDDIPGYVEQGIADLGIVGENIIDETESKVEYIKRLGFGKCTLKLAIPKDSTLQDIKDLNGKAIATSYPNILKNFLDEYKINADIRLISGSVEISPGLGLSDAICDIVSTGGTLKSNGLKPFADVKNSEAILVGRKGLEGNEILAELVQRIESVLLAKETKYVVLNVEKKNLPAITTLLHGVKSPTVVPLAEEGWVAVHTVITEDDFWDKINKLKAEGAQGIVVMPIEKNHSLNLMHLYKHVKKYDYKSLGQTEIRQLVARNTDPNNAIQEVVQEIIQQVRQQGDIVLREYAAKFDKVELDRLYLDEEDIEELASTIDRDQQRALEIAFQNIHKFHSTQLKRERTVETMPGVKCWREVRPIEKVGLYIPGGSAVLPSTLLMLGVPARIAGCKEIVVCSPPQSNGKINGFVAFCLKLLKINRIYLVGGAQAVAAMGFGTETIPKVDKIFGPGNQFVTKAKSIIQGLVNVSIDMPAGPSEVLVIADESANAAFVAADLLAQAEHGADSQAVLVATSNNIVDAVNTALVAQLAVLPRRELAANAIENSYAVTVENLQEAIQFSNDYAPEHLILETDQWESLTRYIGNAGSVFLGHLTPESAGDYASGTNHTLPTSGYARSYSGVSVDSFVKKITFQHINETGLQQIGSVVEILAELEGLQAHKNAISIRKK